jgi:hypothetical protein
MMRQGRHRRQRGTLLPATLRGSANEQANILTPEPPRRPLLAGRVPKGLPLGREISKASWDTEEECVVFLKGGSINGWVGGFGACMQL